MHIRSHLRTLALTGLVALAALAPAQSVLNLAMPGSAGPVIDPHRASNVGQYTVAQLMADPLVMYEDGAYLPALAESWTVSDDGRTVTFMLREGVTYHDGRPVDADSIVWNVERITDPADPLVLASQFATLEAITARDAYVVEMTLSGVDPEFLLKLTSVGMVSPAAGEGGAPVGAGPFVVQEFLPDERMTLTRNEAYWAGAPALETIVVRNIPDPSTLVLELEAGTVDLVTFAPLSQARRLEAAGFTLATFGRINTAVLAINNVAVSDARLRQAICYAVDRDVVLDVAYAGLGRPQTTIALQGSWAHDPDVTGYTYDAERARAILDEAGFVDTNGDGIREIDGRPIDLDFQSRSDGEWLLATQILQQYLADVGIGTTITAHDSATYYANVRTGAYELGWWLSNAQPEPPIVEYVFHSGDFWNVIQKHRPRVDELVMIGRTNADQDVRAEAYFELQRIFADEAIQCPLFWVEQAHVYDANLQGVKSTPRGVLYGAHAWRFE